MKTKTATQWRRRNSLALLIASSLLLAPLAAQAAATRPNIVLIMADDMGWSDIGCYGGEIPTPHIDSLARDGLRFTQFYNNAVCGPTRVSLLTGLYPQQVGHSGRAWNQPKDFSKCVLIPEVLQANGYHNMMVGKWQGRDLAVKRGFHRFFGPNCQLKISYYHEVKDNQFYLNDKRWQFPNEGFYMTDAFNDYSDEFLKEAVKKDDPFFLYVAHIAPHWPLHAPEKYVGNIANVISKKAGTNGATSGRTVRRKWASSQRTPRSPQRIAPSKNGRTIRTRHGRQSEWQSTQRKSPASIAASDNCSKPSKPAERLTTPW
jgi:arylsulfatase A-like enzyme